MMSHAHRVLVQAVPVQAMPVVRGKRRALHAQLMRRTAVPPTREPAMPATLAAPQPHAQPVSLASTKNPLAMMSHALLATLVSRLLVAQPRERRLEVNAVPVMLAFLVLVSMALLDALHALLANILLLLVLLHAQTAKAATGPSKQPLGLSILADVVLEATTVHRGLE